MISPPRWMLKRPGILLPVFFLSLAHTTLTCQVHLPEAASAALGGCYITRQGFFCANQNQAGLGFIEQSSITIQHCKPYLLKAFGSSSISGQFRTGTGAIGIAMISQGLKGFRQTSLWLSYGMKLHSNISAGVGIHLWNSTLEEQFIYAPGISFALGLQSRLNDQWRLGAGLFHPAGWSASLQRYIGKQLTIAVGCSYSFFKSGHIYTELHIKPERGITVCSGVEWSLSPHTSLRTGICNRPSTFSFGVSLKFTKWIAEFSFQYSADAGLSPFTSLTHAW
jgi:hypothetical protein